MSLVLPVWMVASVQPMPIWNALTRIPMSRAAMRCPSSCTVRTTSSSGMKLRL